MKVDRWTEPIHVKLLPTTTRTLSPLNLRQQQSANRDHMAHLTWCSELMGSWWSWWGAFLRTPTQDKWQQQPKEEPLHSLCLWPPREARCDLCTSWGENCLKLKAPWNSNTCGKTISGNCGTVVSLKMCLLHWSFSICSAASGYEFT